MRASARENYIAIACNGVKAPLATREPPPRREITARTHARMSSVHFLYHYGYVSGAVDLSRCRTPTRLVYIYIRVQRTGGGERIHREPAGEKISSVMDTLIIMGRGEVLYALGFFFFCCDWREKSRQRDFFSFTSSGDATTFCGYVFI